MSSRLSTLYFDYQATTPVDPRVRDVMMPFLDTMFGNPASRTHAFGWQAEMAVDHARAQVAKLVGAEPDHVIFTSGATESNNLALLGVLDALPSPAHLIVSAAEHKAVLEVAVAAQHRGVEVTVLAVNRFGQVDVETLTRALRPHTRLISIMWANNEVGSLNPIREIGRLTRSRGILLHSDAAQAAGKVAINMNHDQVDLLSLSGHKMYGPKGVGALIVDRKRVPLKPILFGGSQEWGLRPGTLNVPGIVGLGQAAEIALAECAEETRRLTEWRDRIIGAVTGRRPGTVLNGHPTERLCNNISLSFPDAAEDTCLNLPGIAVSSGSACSSLAKHPSHVLEAMGVPEHLARRTLRIGLGRFTSPLEVEQLLAKLCPEDPKNRYLQ